MKSIDVDGIILDFVSHLFAWHKQELPSNIMWDDNRVNSLFDQIKETKAFWAALPLLNPYELINQYYNFDYYLTAVPEQFKPQRVINLTRMGYPLRTIITCKHQVDDKVKAAKNMGITYHIDDRPETVLAMRKAGIRAFLYVPYYSNISKVIKDANQALKGLDNAENWTFNKFSDLPKLLNI